MFTEFGGGPARQGVDALAHVEKLAHALIPLPDHRIEGISEAGELVDVTDGGDDGGWLLVLDSVALKIVDTI